MDTTTPTPRYVIVCNDPALPHAVALTEDTTEALRLVDAHHEGQAQHYEE